MDYIIFIQFLFCWSHLWHYLIQQVILKKVPLKFLSSMERPVQCTNMAFPKYELWNICKESLKFHNLFELALSLTFVINYSLSIFLEHYKTHMRNWTITATGHWGVSTLRQNKLAKFIRCVSQVSFGSKKGPANSEIKPI